MNTATLYRDLTVQGVTLDFRRGRITLPRTKGQNDTRCISQHQNAQSRALFLYWQPMTTAKIHKQH